MKYYSVKNAAKYLQVSESFLNKNRVTKLQSLPYIKLGKKVIYDKEDLDKFLERRNKSL